MGDEDFLKAGFFSSKASYMALQQNETHEKIKILLDEGDQEGT